VPRGAAIPKAVAVAAIALFLRLKRVVGSSLKKPLSEDGRNEQALGADLVHFCISCTTKGTRFDPLIACEAMRSVGCRPVSEMSRLAV
jgi:hypothetical protein